MLVTHILGDCPSCKGKNSFGNVSVSHDHVLRGCQQCRYQSAVPLPPIQKKVIYLDQFFFSHAFRGGDKQFVNAAEHIKQAVHLQLVVAPFSSIHEDEAHLWRGYDGRDHDQLMKFIKATARGIQFYKPYAIEEKQIYKAWSDFLKGKVVDCSLEDEDAIEGSISDWDDYFWVDVNMYLRDVDRARISKQQSVDTLVKLFDEWKISANTFEQDVAVEMGDAAKNYLSSYLHMVRRLSVGDFSAAINSPIAANVVQNMLRWLPKEQPLADKLSLCSQFFSSDHFNQVPFLWIEARMFATLKDMVKRGAYANRDDARIRLSGIFEDIKHIATYAPYCDAFVMDAPMAEMVRHPNIRLEQRFGVKVFSRSNWNDFLNWLHSLEKSMSEEHMRGIDAAYPSNS
jgi:hypothetical protein